MLIRALRCHHACLSLAFSLALVFGASSLAATLRVPTHFGSIQSAIDFARPGDTVLVAPGTYRESIDFRGKAIVVRGEIGATIDGGGVAPCVSFASGEGRSSVLEGFLLTNGLGARRVIGLYGGGIFIAEASPIIRDNEVRSCIAHFGAGMAILGGSPIVARNVFVENGVEPAAFRGGGAYAEGPGVPRFSSNRFERNTAAPVGGAIHLDGGANAILENETYRENIAYNPGGTGGAVSIRTSIVDVRGAHFEGNRAWRGAGIAIDSGFVTVERSTFVSNLATAEGGAIGVSGTTSQLTLFDNRFERNDTYLTSETWGGAVFARGIESLSGSGNRYQGNDARYGAAIEASNVREVRLENEFFKRNDAWTGDGAVRLVNCRDVSIARSEFEVNVASRRGGAIHAVGEGDESSLQIVSCSFGKNRARYGGAVSLLDVDADVRIANCVMHSGGADSGAAIFIENTPTTIESCTMADGSVWLGGHAIALPEGDESSVAVHRSILWNRYPLQRSMIAGPSVSVSNCIVRDGWPGEGNEDVDPLFVHPPRDYRLRFGSPAIDRFEPTPLDLVSEDFEGEPRVIDGTIDGVDLVDLGGDESNPVVASRFGSVRATRVVEGLQDVLFVNGIAGDERRTVVLRRSERLHIDMAVPSAGPDPARFVLYAYRDAPDAATVRPQPFGLGLTAFPTPLQRGEGYPIMITWNNLGFTHRLGEADRDSMPAPSRVLEVPNGLGFEATVTLQGFIEDAASGADAPVSITNAVVIRIVQ